MEIGVVRRAEKDGKLGDPFITLDNKIKSITMEVEVWDRDSKSTVLKQLELVPNDKGKFIISLNDAQENAEFRLKKEWDTQERYEQKIETYNKYNISRVLTAKVE